MLLKCYITYCHENQICLFLRRWNATIGLCIWTRVPKPWKQSSNISLFTKRDLVFSFLPLASVNALIFINSGIIFLTSSAYDGRWWNLFLVDTLQNESKCFTKFIRCGNSFEWSRVLSFVWKPEHVFLLSIQKLNIFI